MKNLTEKNLVCLICFLVFSFGLFAQSNTTKKEISDSERDMIQKTFQEISISDQVYRNRLAKGTLDEKIIAQIDSVFDNEGIEAGLVYEKNLSLSLPKEVKDSLWQLQAEIDFQNHLKLRGLFEMYGFIPKEIVKEKQYVQLLLLMHPPKDWDVRTYLEEYSEIFISEVNAGRMPAKTYATFYDNMKGKILKEPQLYGTNQVFDKETNKVLPPIIENLAKSNKARKDIGMPILKEGEYRLAVK